MKKFFLWLLRKNKTAFIYMKSGNVLVLKNLMTLNIKKRDAQVVEMGWEFGFSPFGSTQVMNINVDQIEAVMVK